MDYRKEIEDLAVQQHARVFYDLDNPMGAYARTTLRELHLSPWASDDRTASIQYWIAMHELGHIARQHLRSPFDGSPQVTTDEAEAWDWALDHASIPLNASGRTAIGASMASYFYSMGIPQPAPQPLKRIVDNVGPTVDLSFNEEDLRNNGITVDFAEAQWTRGYNELASAA